MVTTTHTDDYLGLDLVSIDTDARDYMGRRTTTDRDYMGRLLHGGSAEPDPETLLDEAAVRFDFSQYTDVNDMVDVNGEWGPFIANVTGATTTEFTAAGLHLVGNQINQSFTIDNTPSPIVAGADGITFIDVVRIDAAFNLAANENGISVVELAGDGDNDYAPNFYSLWAAQADDTYWTYSIDLAPGYDYITNLDQAGQSSGLSSSSISSGVFVHTVVVDVTAQEQRLTLASPEARFDVVIPFDKAVPDFVASPTVIDLFYLGGGAKIPDDFTRIEWAAWNRALTGAEVAALITHFG